MTSKTQGKLTDEQVMLGEFYRWLELRAAHLRAERNKQAAESELSRASDSAAKPAKNSR